METQTQSLPISLEGEFNEMDYGIPEQHNPIRTSTDDDHGVAHVRDYLAHRTIALCITGGIAAIETPKIARMQNRI